MVPTVSKSEFKARALEWFRRVQNTGQALVITDRGVPVLRLEPIRPAEADPLTRLRGCVTRFDDPEAPVGVDDWETLA